MNDFMKGIVGYFETLQGTWRDTPAYMIGCINEIGTKQKADNISGLLGESSLKGYLQEFYPLFPSGYLLRLGIDDFKGIISPPFCFI